MQRSVNLKRRHCLSKRAQRQLKSVLTRQHARLLCCEHLTKRMLKISG